jgi:glycosyltransferase involved in cell wall biosynthesis
MAGVRQIGSAMKRLSIIIPVYNADKYLEECLRSVVKNNYADMEVIIVNDGSRDDSLSICNKYKDLDNRIQIIDKKNTGVSDSRNVGIRASQGQYIMFLDADDFMESDSFNIVIEDINSNKYDFIAYSYYTFKKNDARKEELYAIDKECSDLQVIREYMLASSTLNTCWGKLFLAKVIKDNQITFRTDLKIGEDFVFVAEYFMKIRSAIIKNVPVINYRQHGESAMHKYDFMTRIWYTDYLFRFNKGCLEMIEDKEIMNKMYVYYLRVITNIMLEFARSNKSLVKLYKKAFEFESINEIIDTIDIRSTSSYKKFECALLKKRWYSIMSIYFRIKSCF